MNRDIIVKCSLSAEEYVGLAHLADDAGVSQSAMIRNLIKREIVTHAIKLHAQAGDDRPEMGPE